LVQGDAAPSGIVRAIKRLNGRDDVDVILLVRGGGSLEDLWAFNDEAVARAVAASRLPLVSGVGHETDFSLADFASDRRAPTPSAAAELVTPELTELRTGLWQMQTRMTRAVSQQLSRSREWLATSQRALQHLSPLLRVQSGRQRIDDLGLRMEGAMDHRIQMAYQRVGGLRARLTSLNPEAVLLRGYAIVRQRETGSLLTSVRQATAGLPLELEFSDGSVAAHIDDV
jgi:exodeoxyribonuclease VII large subunit